MVDEGNRLIQFHYEGIFEEILDQLGEMPLPPYITIIKDKIATRLFMQKNEGSAACSYSRSAFHQRTSGTGESQGRKYCPCNSSRRVLELSARLK